MAKSKQGGLMRYLKKAFLYKWNVLFFAGAAAAAVLSGSPDVVLPIVAAGELAYLATLTSIPRFRAAVDAQEHAASRPAVKASGARRTRAVGDMLKDLGGDARQRFQRLRARCLDMRRIAHGVRGRADEGGAGDDARTPALDRLLWVFLRLLFSQQALKRFLDTTDESKIRATLAKLHERRAAAEAKQDERILRSIADSIATAELRLENYDKAESNAEFVDVELDRIEGKIQALTEMSVSHEDPDYISSQVDSVAESMVHTEKAIKELNYITGLTDELEEDAPRILESDLAEVLEA